MNAVKEHLSFSVEWKGEKVGIAEMKRHYTNYFKGIPHFKDYRIRLVTSDTLEEVRIILAEIEQFLSEATGVN